jgi:hypothetical protein
VARGLADRPRGPGAAVLDRAAQGSRRLHWSPRREAEDHRRGRAPSSPCAWTARARPWCSPPMSATWSRRAPTTSDPCRDGSGHRRATALRPRPRGLEALIARPVFYDLVEMAERRDLAALFGVGSNGAWFPTVRPARMTGEHDAGRRCAPGSPAGSTRSEIPPAAPVRSDYDLDPACSRAGQPADAARRRAGRPGRAPGGADGPADPPLRHPAQAHRPDRLSGRPLRSGRDALGDRLARGARGDRPGSAASSPWRACRRPTAPAPAFWSRRWSGFVAPDASLTPNPRRGGRDLRDAVRLPDGSGEPQAPQASTCPTATGGFYAMTHEDRVIWGATAGMLRQLYERALPPKIRVICSRG